jgi:hypothetical protein
MAIATWDEPQLDQLELDEPGGCPDRVDPLESPWPRPALRVVACPRTSPQVSRPLDVTLRRARRAALQRRRRTILVSGAVAALAVGLALPIGALGGAPAPSPHPGTRPATAGEIVYVVQPGDTLWSIAARLDRGGNPRALAEALARETGSATVVPGERIVVP